MITSILLTAALLSAPTPSPKAMEQAKLIRALLIGPGGMRFNSRMLAAAWRHYVKSSLPRCESDTVDLNGQPHNQREA